LCQINSQYIRVALLDSTGKREKVICIERERKKKEKKSRSMRETFHWNSEISLSCDVLTRGGHTNRKKRNKTHKKSSSSLSLFFLLFFCLLLSCSGRQREGEINVKTKARISSRHRAPGRISYPYAKINNCILSNIIGKNEDLFL